MYAAPVFTQLSVYEYRRILALPQDRVEHVYPRREDSRTLEIQIEATRLEIDLSVKHAEALWGRMLYLKRKLRLARQREANAGWPIVERRKTPRQMPRKTP